MTTRQDHRACNQCKPSTELKSDGHKPISDLQLHREIFEISLAKSLCYEDGVWMQRTRGPNQVGCQQNRKSVWFTAIKRKTGEVQAAFIPVKQQQCTLLALVLQKTGQAGTGYKDWEMSLLCKLGEAFTSALSSCYVSFTASGEQWL